MNRDEDAAFDLGKQPQKPYAYVQWKNIDVCMDFHCECGRHVHVDATAVYAVKCPDCGTIWEMPSYLFPRKVERHDCVHYPRDED